jgi:nicotinamide-nucleotide amidase
MFEHYIFPDLTHYLQQQPRFKKKWRLFNVSESHIAAELEQALTGFNVVTGYRIDYPYLEFKIEAPINCDVDKLLTAVTPLIKPHLLADEYIPASQLLKEKLATLTHPILIVDDATGGLLQTTLSSKQNYHDVYFAEGSKNKADFQAIITVSGLKEYWQNLDESKTTTIHMTFSSAAGTQEFNAEIPYRPIRIVKYAVELAASQILNYLQEIKN